ncbi:hypothetical protein I6A84_43585 [Frankia sp. CNm7]|uniref:Uncharacterized protein n=1 Tax=Frankia nepalensis TaxID=1836974 RepID=A0A937RJI3_9ACTN|nr:hypothetical protein [Frankia nepalensis]MBL7495868.1 hypothetical protein [Frankia nepalensis]MBL7510405.1 hypothetical protein [Frankia nepalensis]MBL7524746.1 hypothetical protein [Frankia nepalensis]MBL7630004.1 hypothetical protein [Frankia nepalensis]
MRKLVSAGAVGLVVGVVLTLLGVAVVSIAGEHGAPRIVAEVCDPSLAGEGTGYCVQLRADGSEHGELWVLHRMGTSTAPRVAAYASPFTDLRYDLPGAFEKSVAFAEDGTITVHGRDGAALTLPLENYKITA